MTAQPPVVEGVAGEGGMFGSALDRWLQHLDEQGFRVGVRDRLLVQALLARLAAHGELPADLHDALAMAAPLVCNSREQQRHYATLLRAFVAADARGEGKADDRRERRPDARRPGRTASAVAATVVAAAAAIAGLWLTRVPPPAADPPPAAPATPAPGSPTTESPAPEAAAPFVVPALPLPLQPDRPPAWSPLARTAVGAVGAAALLAWAASLWAMRKRRLAMFGVRTDEELEAHLLHDAEPVDIAPHPVLARMVGRALRQRVGGDARVLDLPSTVRATVASQGAFAPRWRELQLTPEYLALVDTRHPHDHHAAAVHAQLDALTRAGVALQVWGYETTPTAGCWLRGGHGNDDPLTRHRVPLAALAARAAGQRLLVFGPADVLQHPLAGTLQPWVSALLPLTERAWITPQPVHAWGAAERLADEAGFLVLPLQEASLTTLAGWLTSRRLELALDPDSPTSVPTLLQGKALEWVTRGDAPPAETRQALLRQLRAMLGGLRFQWLCGCAIFPTLAPPLTLALGRHLLPEARSLALGLAAFSALPWFRWGRMPDWLRESLVAELAPDIRARLESEVHDRLDRALQSGSGPALADVATRKRRLLGALRQRRGPLRDAVLADFVRRDTDPGLAQRLPEGLRRRLFKHGDPAEGLLPLAHAAAALGGLALVTAATPLWTALVGMSPQPALPALTTPVVRDPAVTPSTPYELRAVGLRAVGESLVLVTFTTTGGTAAWADFAPEATGTADGMAVDTAALSKASVALSTTAPDGTAIRLIDGRVQLTDHDGRGLGAPLAWSTGARVRLAAFTPSGGRVVALLDDGTWASWGAPWPTRMEAVVACNGGSVDSGAAAVVARALAPLADGSQPGREADALDLNTVVFADSAWVSTGFPVKPMAGAVLRSERYDAGRASRVLERLRGLASRVPLPEWAASTTVVGSTAGNLLVVGACLPAANEPPSAASTSDASTALFDRVKALFAPDAAERKDAAAKLILDQEHLSDAIDPALTLALNAQRLRTPVREPELSGIFNTLVLLRSASPATLRRESARVEQLVALSALNGEQTRQEGRRVAARLKDALPLRPVIHLRIADRAQQALAERLAQRLGPADIETVGDRAPARTEIRVQGFSDRNGARTLSDLFGTIGGATVVSLRQTPANDTYEIWLGRDLCHARQVPGCAAEAPVPTQQSPASAPVAAKQSREPPSDALVEMVAAFVGLQDGDSQTPKLDAYVNAGGYWMIGYDHPLTRGGEYLRQKDHPVRTSLQGLTLTFGPRDVVNVLDGITPEQARELLRADLADGLASVDAMVNVPLARYQREALADFVYSAGAASLRGSTLLRQVNAGNFDAVPAELRRRSTVAGKQLPGLSQRRAAEAAMWQGADWRSALPRETKK